MDLHGITSGAIDQVNPFVPASMRISTGATTNGDGSRTPTYKDVTGTAQVQPLSFKDLHQVAGLNLNGSRRAIYFYGKFDGVVRPTQKGGDLVTILEGTNYGVWLVAQVLEQWPTFVKVCVTLQNDGPQ